MSRLPRAWPHLLCTNESPETLRPIFVAAREAALRIGWLALDLEAAPSPLPATLETAAALGALRAVGVGGGRSIAVKPVAGLPVMRDLLREHMTGTALVLVTGAPERLGGLDHPPRRLCAEVDTGALRIVEETEGEEKMVWTGSARVLVERLRRPRPW